MKIERLKLFVSTLAVMMVVATACAQQPAPSDQVDTDGIVETVLTRLEQQDAGQQSNTIDPDAIAESVVATLTATGENGQVDTEAITQSVIDTLQQQIEDQGSIINANIPAEVQTMLTLEENLISLYERANPATVFVLVPPLGSGTGFVYSEDGYIVTNNHVVQGGSDFEVVFSTGDRLRATLIGTDVDSDLAVIKVDNIPAGVEPLPLADPDSIRVGQIVIAIGNPFGEQGSMSLGIVSGLDRSLQSGRAFTEQSAYSLPSVIQTDAPINPGNSGGPLINLAGEVLGVNSAIRSNTGTNSGVGFAIPVAALHTIIPNLIQNGQHVYSYMGAGFDEEVSLDEQAIYSLPQTAGAYVLSVTADGPADRAGLQAANRTTGNGGDLVIALDGEPITDFSDLNSYLVFNKSAGDTVEVTVIRDGEEVTFSMTLGARP